MKHLLPAATLAIALLAPIAPSNAAPAPKLIPLLANAKSFSVTETLLTPNSQSKLTVIGNRQVQFQQGDKYYADTQSTNGGHIVHEIGVSDGKHRYLYSPATAQYQQVPAVNDFIAVSRRRLAMLPPVKSISTTFNGKPALLYQQFFPATGVPESLTKTWLDAKTHLRLRMSAVDLTGKTPKTLSQVNYSDWKINPVIPAARFVFMPPAGAKEVSVPTPPAQPKLLANGTEAPDFAVQDKDGKTVHLSDYKGKVVVLDFWATWCGPCQASLPHTESVAAQFAPQGVVMLAVNVWDKHDAFEQWLPKHADFKDIAFLFDPSDSSMAVTKAYAVSGIPTQYVVGKDGKIVQSFVGYDGPTDDLADALALALKG